MEKVKNDFDKYVALIEKEASTTKLHHLLAKRSHVNVKSKVIIDLKTTNDINKFDCSAKKYNYDSQAYIYKKIFGYDILFLVIDKNTNQIGIYDCSDQFYDSGLDKVQRAIEAYDKIFNSKDFDPDQFFITKTL